MNSTNSQTVPAPPGLISALLGGFDAITNHIRVILFPVLLDIFLWLGPHLRLETIVQRILQDINSLPGIDASENLQALSVTREIWLVIAQRLNLFTLLRSYPVGVPSLMASRLPIETPLYTPQMVDVTSSWMVLGLWAGLTLLGLLIGTFYYLTVAQVALTGRLELRSALAQWAWSARQVILLALMMGGVFLAVAIPGSCILSLTMMSGLSLGGLSVMLYIALLVWILFPLLFSAHGIFAYQHKVWQAIRHSASLTRLTLIRTSLLLLTVLLISEGLDTLWRVPPENSWLVLIGVAGHAFVTTSLLAASFIYYRDATRWMQRLAQQSVMIGPDKKASEKLM